MVVLPDSFRRLVLDVHCIRIVVRLVEQENDLIDDIEGEPSQTLELLAENGRGRDPGRCAGKVDHVAHAAASIDSR
ncbi:MULTISPECIES: hypothetical protein [Methylobacterium]|jgi:hypothetical protein|uniref:hypothetical protein n=1 Tax=Methylobacterium TaxID=407 RepID=UPI0008F05B0E|nr:MULTISPECIES: hypothetical protein [Methylobacterium]MBK3412505.1 hypothetical protein [Methylobacterium ajmalii]SFF67915.1 hypothetical protein SAMN04487844_13727 [Methylobacterium sp. yr596]